MIIKECAPISVIIPAFNSASTILRALNTVALQSLAPLEIIVVDDHSTDETVNIVQLFAKGSKIETRLTTTNENSGAGTARNVGWSMADGEFIAFLDADDLWHPQKLEIQYNFLRQNSQLAMSCHDRKVTESEHWENVQADTISVSKYSLRHFLVRNRCSTPTVMVRSSLQQRFEDKKRYAEDYLLWMTICSHYGSIQFLHVSLTHCSNPIYGGKGLSGGFRNMQSGESAAFISLFRSGAINLTTLLAAISWSYIKFLIRVFDYYILGGRRQTVSESK